METIKQSLFKLKYNKQLLKQCQEKLKSFLLRLLSLWRVFSLTVISSVHQVTPGGRVVLKEIASNKRHLVGGLFLLSGVLAISFHQFFLNEGLRDFSWYYVNSHYFYFTLRPYIILILWSAGFVLLIPTKYKLSFIPFSLAHSLGWIGMLHYSLFVNSNKSFHAFPNWYCLVIGLCVGFAFIMSLDYLCYRKYHMKDGTLSRVKGIVKAPNIPIEVRYKHLETLVAEAENFNARV